MLEKVCEYFYYNEKHKNSKDVPDIDVPAELCLELLMAADYLNGGSFSSPFSSRLTVGLKWRLGEVKVLMSFIQSDRGKTQESRGVHLRTLRRRMIGKWVAAFERKEHFSSCPPVPAPIVAGQGRANCCTLARVFDHEVFLSVCFQCHWNTYARHELLYRVLLRVHF